MSTLEHRSQLRMNDSIARAQAQREFSKPLVLEAGAGTGKTTVLMARVVAWCLGPGWQKAEQIVTQGEPFFTKEQFLEDVIASRVLRRVVAITFTEAASAEMASRITQAFSELAQGEIPLGIDPEALPSDHKTRSIRAKALLVNLDRLTIQTIHAFCLGLLRRFPLEAGFHPNVMVDADGLFLEEMAREIVDLHLSRAMANGDDDIMALLENELSPNQILEALINMAEQGVPLEAMEADYFKEEKVARSIAIMREAIEDFFKKGGVRLFEIKGRNTGGSKTVATLYTLERTRETLEGMRSFSPEDLQRTCEEMRKIWEGNLDRLSNWASGKFNKGERDAVENREELSLCAQRLNRWIEHLCSLNPGLFKSVQRTLGKLLRSLYWEMRSRGVLTFGWILQGTRELLRKNPDVTSYVRGSLDQILVDEFQDTDSVQCEIIKMISLEGPAEERPGLFIVGDPKQSIYGWRNADLAAYESFVEEVCQKGGEKLILSVNFRSAPSILEEVDRVMEKVMIYQPGIQPRFEPLVPCEEMEKVRSFSIPSWTCVEYWVSDFPKDPNEKKIPSRLALSREAQALASDLLRLHREAQVPWSEIGVLLRTTSDLEVYLEALRKAGIPYSASVDKTYFRRREVLDAVSLVLTILDPTDQIALVSFLRSAAAGVPDAAWINLWTKGFPEAVARLEDPNPYQLNMLKDMLQETASSLPSTIPGIERIDGWQWSVLAALEAIARLRKSFREDPHDLFVEKIRNFSLLEATEAAKYMGKYRVANLERFFRWLLAAMETTRGNTQGLVRVLRSSARRIRELQQANPKGVQEDAVRVMTIHKAKGLDFSHVYILQAHKSTGRDEEKKTKVELTAEGWQCCLLGLPSLGYMEVEEKEKAVSEAELIRTLYVAMTRAKFRLVIAGKFTEDTRRKEKEVYSGILKKRGSGPWEKHWKPQNGSSRDEFFRDEFGVLWRPLGALDYGMELPKPGHFSEKFPSREKLEEENLKLRSLLSTSKARMERLWKEEMSEEAHWALERSFREGGFFLGGDGERRLAMLVGSLCHRALESINFDCDLKEELIRVENACVGELKRSLPETQFRVALSRMKEIFSALRRGNILGRLEDIRSHILARELPVLMAPEEEEGPVGFWAGAVDLLYRDPKSGHIVVVDYKTDSIPTPDQVDRLCAIYSTQGAHYVKALRQMFGKGETVELEIWFLQADTMRKVSLT